MHEDARLGRVRSAGWKRVARGVFVPSDSEDLLSALSLVLKSSAAFTHLTAARQYGWWLPPLPADLPVFVSQLASEPRTRRQGVHVFRHREQFDVRHLRGHPLASPAETLLACARHLGVIDLVVLVDSALHRHDVSIAALEQLAGAGRVGTPALRQALRYADGRSESPWETVLRMLHVACDIDVEPQRDFVTADGLFVARADLWLVGTDTIHEYDGSTHLTRAGQRHDLARLRRIGDAALVRRGYTSAEVTGDAASILQDADRSLGRPYDADRLQRWYAWLQDSCFSSTGRERLLQRLGLRKGH